MSNRNKHVMRTGAAALAATAVLTGVGAGAMPVFAAEPVTDKSHTAEADTNGTAVDIKGAEQNLKDKLAVVEGKRKAYNAAAEAKNAADQALASAQDSVKSANASVDQTKQAIAQNQNNTSKVNADITANESDIQNADKDIAEKESALKDIIAANPAGADAVLTQREKEAEDAANALSDAENAFAQAETNAETARADLDAKTNALANAKTAETEALSNQKTAEDALNTAKAEQAKAEADLQDAIDLRDNKTTRENTKAYKDLQDAKAAVASAESDYNKAVKDVTDAEAVLQTAQDAKKKAEADPTNADVTKQTYPNPDEAETALINAQNNASEKKAALDQASSDAEAKQKAYDTALQAEKDAESKVTEAENAKKTADSAVESAQANLDNAAADAKAKADAVTTAQNAYDSAVKAENDADAKVKNSQTAYDTAVSNKAKADTTVETAQKAKDDADAKVKAAEAVIAKGSLGFFEERAKDTSLTEDERQDAEEAAAIIRYAAEKDSWDVANEPQCTHGVPEGITYIGREDDATSLENMRAAVDLIAEGNDRRMQDDNFPGLSALNVTDSMMAYAQASANMEAYTLYHWKPLGTPQGDDPYHVLHPYYNIGENSSWGSSNIAYHDSHYNAWYRDEKQVYNAHPEIKGMNLNQVGTNYPNLLPGVGHYLNIVSSTYKSTGLAVNERSPEYGTAAVQSFNNKLAGIDYDTYKNAFYTYYNKVTKDLTDAQAEAKTAEDALTTAKTAQTTAAQAVSNAKNALDQAKADSKTAELSQAVTNAETALNQAKAAKTTADEKVESLTTALSNAKDDQGKKADAVTSAVNVYNSKASETAKAKTAKDSSDSAKQSAEEAYQNAVSLVSSKADAVIAEAQAVVAEKTSVKDEKETALNNAKKVQADRQDDFDAIVSGKAIPGLTKAVNDAKTKTSDADQAKTDADQAVTSAQDAVKKAETAKTNAENTKTKADQNASNKQDAVTSAKKDSESKASALKESQDAKAKITAGENAVQAAENKKAGLTTENTRLKSLLDSLQKELDSLNKKLSDAELAAEDAKDAEALASQNQTNAKDAADTALNAYDKARADAEPDRLIYDDMLAIEEGNGSTFDNAAPSALTFRANGSLDWFTDFRVDGNSVPSDQYTLVSGSTIVTLKPEYMKTLEPGQHTFQFLYQYGETETGTFTVKAAPVATAASAKTDVPAGNVKAGTTRTTETVSNPNDKSAKTGDTEETPLGLLAGLMAGVAALGVSLRKKRS